MIATHLSLANFRNYETADVALQPGFNLFIGRNGQGKTNLVESLGYLSTVASHRVSNDRALIRQGTDAAVIRARIAHAGREILLEVQLNRDSPNRAQANRSAIKPRDLPGYFSSVLFAPEDLALIRGEPAIRRRFIDELLVQRTPRMSGVLADYDRVVRQRNTLLKSARASGLRDSQLSTLEIWDERLIALGSEVIDARRSLLALMGPPLADAYRSVAGADHAPIMREELSILGAVAEDSSGEPSPVPSIHGSGTEPRAGATTHDFAAALGRVRRAERDRGITLVGPHRDDVLLELNGLPAKGYASHGESWSFALALKLASAQLLRADSATGDPVVILDDVFAELDQSRRRLLAQAIGNFEQVLITAAVLEDVPAELQGNLIRIDAGAIVDD